MPLMSQGYAGGADLCGESKKVFFFFLRVTHCFELRTYTNLLQPFQGAAIGDSLIEVAGIASSLHLVRISLAKHYPL